MKCRVGQAGLRGPATMTTENISRNGMLLCWEPDVLAPLPRVGDLLTVEVELPAHHGFEQKCIHCQTTVSRVSTSERGPRVALTVNYMDFRSLGQRLPVWAAPVEWSV